MLWTLCVVVYYMSGKCILRVLQHLCEMLFGLAARCDMAAGWCGSGGSCCSPDSAFQSCRETCFVRTWTGPVSESGHSA